MRGFDTPNIPLDEMHNHTFFQVIHNGWIDKILRADDISTIKNLLTIDADFKYYNN